MSFKFVKEWLLRFRATLVDVVMDRIALDVRNIHIHVSFIRAANSKRSTEDGRQASRRTRATSALTAFAV